MMSENNKGNYELPFRNGKIWNINIIILKIANYYFVEQKGWGS